MALRRSNRWSADVQLRPDLQVQARLFITKRDEQVRHKPGEEISLRLL